jgi:hypothetical protein
MSRCSPVDIATAYGLDDRVRVPVGSRSLTPSVQTDRLFGVVARVPGYRSRGPGSVTGVTKFSEK